MHIVIIHSVSRRYYIIIWQTCVGNRQAGQTAPVSSHTLSARGLGTARTKQVKMLHAFSIFRVLFSWIDWRMYEWHALFLSFFSYFYKNTSLCALNWCTSIASSGHHEAEVVVGVFVYVEKYNKTWTFSNLSVKKDQQKQWRTQRRSKAKDMRRGTVGVTTFRRRCWELRVHCTWCNLQLLR